jgi:hypothetical protein
VSATHGWPLDGDIEFPEPTVPPLTKEEEAALRGGEPMLRAVDEARPPDGPVFTDLRDVQQRDVEWLDKPFLPWAELVTVNADGDTGKGLYAVHQAARCHAASSATGAWSCSRSPRTPSRPS